MVSTEEEYMKGIIASLVIWGALLLLVTGCYPVHSAMHCDPYRWANNRCTGSVADREPAPAQSKPEKPTPPDKPTPDPDPDPDPDHCPPKR